MKEKNRDNRVAGVSEISVYSVLPFILVLNNDGNISGQWERLFAQFIQVPDLLWSQVG